MSDINNILVRNPTSWPRFHTILAHFTQKGGTKATIERILAKTTPKPLDFTQKQRILAQNSGI